MNRHDELAANLAHVQSDIASICSDIGRDLPTVIVVTKTKPVTDVDILATLGVTDVGENRDQEAAPKKEESHAIGLTWHAIGQLQTNKAKSVAQWADVVHSVDRADLVVALAKATVQRQVPLGALIQVNLDPDPQDHRGGCLPSEVAQLAAQMCAIATLELKGVMGVAPLNGDPEQAFSRLAAMHSDLLTEYPQAQWMSAGMSEDYVAALRHGATHLRIGSSILGHRLPKG